MKLVPTPLAGAYVVELEPLTDERGHFARTFDAEQFAAAGLDARIAQCNTSFNEQAGTLRGLHYQAEPHGEGKLVRCTRGAVWDVAVDLSPHKQGRLLPGSHIPIRAPEAIREDKPDVVLILPWNLKEEIIEQLSFIREWGGKFAVRTPELTLLP